MILTGLSAVVIIEIYAAVMQREFSSTDNKTGKGFAVLGIYLFVVAYCTSRILPAPTRVVRAVEANGRKANR